MPRRFLLVLLILMAGLSPALADKAKDRAEERARKKAWEEAQRVFAVDYRSEKPKRRRAAILKLRDFLDMGAAQLIVNKVLPKERNYSVMEAAIAVVGKSREPAVVSFLATKATGRDPWPVRCAVVEALEKLDSPSVDSAIKRLLQREKDPRVLSMALFVAGARGLTDTFELVLPHLEHEDWQVRVGAIEALGLFGDDRAVVPLIDQLMNEKGRLRDDLAQALRKLTKQNFGRDANEWRKWYVGSLEGGAPEGGAKPDGGQPKAHPRDPDPNAPATSEVAEPTYFGIKVTSERVLFVIDVSMSMLTPIDVDKMKMAREVVMTGGEVKEEERDEKFEDTIKWWLIQDRLDLAKAQLMFVVKNLRENQKFELLSFSEKITPWNAGQPIKASKRAKVKATLWIEQLKDEEATAAGAALDFAFEMAGKGASDKNYKSGVDTIFFLSDGAPSDRNAEEILTDVRNRNKLRKIKVHTICICNYSVGFLRLLAEQNGGTYKFFKVEDKK